MPSEIDANLIYAISQGGPATLRQTPLNLRADSYHRSFIIYKRHTQAESTTVRLVCPVIKHSCESMREFVKHKYLPVHKLPQRPIKPLSGPTLLLHLTRMLAKLTTSQRTWITPCYQREMLSIDASRSC